MKAKTYLLAAALGLLGVPVRAQYEFKDVADATATYAGKVPDRSAGLAPYVQSFDLPAANTSLAFTSSADRSSKNFSGVYASFTLGAATTTEYVAGFNSVAPFTPTPIPANDGSTTNTNWYHFGDAGSLERAFGGIGGNVVVGNVTYPSGVGYIGLRFKNSSSVTIKNLEVRYAMEQWYNSSISQSASCRVDFQRSVRSGTAPSYTYTPASLTALTGGTWTSVPQLRIDAPSTSAPIAERNGNSPTNRRTAKTTLAGLNLLPGEEIMIRFNYVFDATTNGNGMSIDDVVVAPETNVYYSTTTGSLDQLNSWGTNLDGTGTRPASFTAANQVFYVMGNVTTNRVQTGQGWTVSGANSKVVVGLPASPAIGPTVGRSASPASLLIEAGQKTIAAPAIDVIDGSTIVVNQVNPAITFGYLAPTSTVEYASAAGATHTLLPGTYGNLKVSGLGAKVLGGTTVVAGNLDLNASAGLTLGNYDLTLLRPATVTASYTGSVLNAGSAAYVITSGTGRLRQSVPNTGTNILFPVGTSTSYTPARLQQATSKREDVYGVRVIDGAYETYDANEVGSTPVSYRNVNKTWLVSEEVPSGADVTLNLQWNATDATADFVPALAHINHYTGGGWDNYPTTLSYAANGTVYSVSRAGITSFSPFGVSSRGGGVLPVELTAFTAQRQPAGVQCAWSTASEANNARFVVERSLDARHFQAVGSVAGAGSSTQARRYTFLDRQPASGLLYYRLRQVDADGKEALSGVVTVARCADCAPAAVSISPNPTAGRFELVTALDAATVLPLSISTAVGTPVLTRQLPVAAGLQRTPFDLSGQPAGLYLVRLLTPTGPVQLRVMKQ